MHAPVPTPCGHVNPVQGGGLDGSKLLALMARLLTAQGLENVAVDSVQWRVSAWSGGHAAAGTGTAAAAAAAKVSESSTAGAGAGAVDGRPTGGATGEQAPGGKRQKTGGGVGSGSSGSGTPVQFKVFSRSRGKFDVMVSVPNTAGLPEATWFAHVARRLQADVAAHWQ